MLKPLTMNNNLRFCAKSFEGNRSNNTDLKEISDMAENLRQKSNKDKMQNAFIIGAAVGSIISAAGLSMYKNYELNSMLNEMAAEVAYDKIDSIEVKDVTKDKNFDIILHGSDGASTVYDMRNNDIYIDMDGDLIKQDR